MAQDPGRQVIPIVEGQYVPRAYAQPVEEEDQGRTGWGKGPRWAGQEVSPASGAGLPDPRHSHSDVQHDALVLLHMHTPDAVLPSAIRLRPVWREHHARRVCDLPAAHGCKEGEAGKAHSLQYGVQECPPPPLGVPTSSLRGKYQSHTTEPPAPGSVACSWVSTLIYCPGRPTPWCLLTSAGWLCLIPLGVVEVDTLDDDGALLQGVARVTAELHSGTHGVGGSAAAEVAVFDKRLVAVALLKGCEPQGPAQLSLHRGRPGGGCSPTSLLGAFLPQCKWARNRRPGKQGIRPSFGQEAILNHPTAFLLASWCLVYRRCSILFLMS